MAGVPGAGPDAAGDGFNTLVQQVRTIHTAAKQIEMDLPPLAPDVQQITALLNQLLVKAAQLMPQQTISGAMTPGGGAAM